MIVQATSLPGVLLLEPTLHVDFRGRFLESWNRERYREIGIHHDFVQDNIAFSRRGTLRGLHFQHPGGQAKLVAVTHGAVFDVAVDVRTGSPTFARWYGCTLTAEGARQVFIPAGFAHGYLVLSENATFTYKCSTYYDRAAERAILWNDPAIAIAWPCNPTTLSPRDAAAPPLTAIDPKELPPA